METWCGLHEDARKLLQAAAERAHVSARGIMRLRKIARTIADLSGDHFIHSNHIAEALQYRLSEASHAP